MIVIKPSQCRFHRNK